MKSKKEKYLIFLEIAHFGYVFRSTLGQKKVMLYIREVILCNQNFEFDDLYNLKHLELIIRYTIKGNQKYFGISKRATSDGIITASLVLLKPGFSLKTIIRERENYSIPFDTEKQADQIEKIRDFFPHYVLSAN